MSLGYSQGNRLGLSISRQTASCPVWHFGGGLIFTVLAEYGGPEMMHSLNLENIQRERVWFQSINSYADQFDYP